MENHLGRVTEIGFRLEEIGFRLEEIELPNNELEYSPLEREISDAIYKGVPNCSISRVALLAAKEVSKKWYQSPNEV